jgi:uncharacterized protein (TIGR03086 family)
MGSQQPEKERPMSEVSDRYRRVAGKFTETTRAVPEGAWDDQTPCDEWVARDVVRHLVDWFPPMLHDGSGIELPSGPPVDDDPAGAWTVMSDAVQQILDEPGVHDRVFEHDRAGRHALDDAIDMFFTGDVLVHTWDLARATGTDETLDPDTVAAQLAGMEGMEEALRQSGFYGPRVEVPDDADTQTRLIAFTGRDPSWSRP